MNRARLGHAVTRDAGARLVRLEQGVGRAAVRGVAVRAVFGDRRVFEDPRARVIVMALGAYGRSRPEGLTAVRMRLVAIGTSHHPLPDGVMRGKVQTRRDAGMAARAHLDRSVRMAQHGDLSLLRLANVVRLTVVRVVAVGTQHAISCVL